VRITGYAAAVASDLNCNGATERDIACQRLFEIKQINDRITHIGVQTFSVRLQKQTKTKGISYLVVISIRPRSSRGHGGHVNRMPVAVAVAACVRSERDQACPGDVCNGHFISLLYDAK